jgi:hypothetical protein
VRPVGAGDADATRLLVCLRVAPQLLRRGHGFLRYDAFAVRNFHEYQVGLPTLVIHGFTGFGVVAEFLAQSQIRFVAYADGGETRVRPEIPPMHHGGQRDREIAAVPVLLAPYGNLAFHDLPVAIRLHRHHRAGFAVINRVPEPGQARHLSMVHFQDKVARLQSGRHRRRVACQSRDLDGCPLRGQQRAGERGAHPGWMHMAYPTTIRFGQRILAADPTALREGFVF